MKLFNWILNRKTVAPNMGLGNCLSKEEAAKLRNLDHKKLMDMDSKERFSVFANVIGEENAKWVNTRFEKEFLIKKQKEGMINWANKTDMKSELRKEIIRKISNLEKALGPKELDEFVEELSELSLGIGVTEEEAKTIVELFKKVEDAKVKMKNGGSVTDYEKARDVYQDYIDKLKKS
jgi:hypothetical protein